MSRSVLYAMRCVFCTLVGLLVLVGCSRSRSGPPPSPIASSPLQVARASFPTFSLPTPEATAAPTFTASPSVTPTPTRTPTATPTPFPDVPLPSADDYRLRSPDPGGLLRVLEMAVTYSSLWHLPDHERPVARRQEKALFRLVGSDLQRFYPEGVPDADELTLSSELVIYGIPYGNVLWQILRAGVMQYLNEHSIELQHEMTQELPRFLLTAYRLESPDREAERWLIYVRFVRLPFGYRIEGFIPVELGGTGRYHLVPNTLEPLMFPSSIYAPSETVVHVNHDLASSAQNDIVIHQYGHEGGSSNYWYLDIYTWDKLGLTLAESIHRVYDPLKGLGFPTYDIGDFTGDGRDDLRITTQHNGLFGCQYDRIAIFSWSGKQPRHNEFSNPPDTAACNVRQGMMNIWDDPHQAVGFLERAIEQWTMETTPSADFLAFLYVRLAVAYANQGLDDEAMRALENIYQLPGDASYVRLVQNHLEKVKNYDLVTFCYNLELEEKVAETEIEQYIYPKPEDKGKMPYYWFCLARRLMRNRLKTISFSTANSPVDTLAAANLTFAFARAVNVDADDELEWLGMLEPDRGPHLVILDAVDGHWKPIRIDSWSTRPLVDFQFQLRDVTGDGEPEVITLIALPDGSCEGNLKFKVTVETLSEREYGWTEYFEWSCTPFNLEELDEIYFDLVKPTWYTLLEYDGTSQNLPDYLETLEASVISQTQPLETAKELVDLMAYLLANEAAVQPAIKELKYLLGLNYELMGAEEQAVAAYVDLMRQVPNSPWSWLAWARLEPGNRD